MTRLSLVVVLAGFVLMGPAAAQQVPTFRAGSETVAIYTTVVDAAGRLVPDLEREHFEVYDNGKLQELTVFKSDVQPVSVVLTLDMSGSMTLHLELLKQAAVQFVIRLLPADRARINAFSDGRGRISPIFTSDRDELIRYIHDDTQFGNGTRLWDAVDESMTALAKEESRRVVLVFSDGDDTDSKKAKFDDLMSRAQAEAYMIYCIGLRTRIPGQFESRPDRGLKRLADETGGGYFEMTRATELGSAFTRVADELHRQYVLGFTAATLDGKPHKLDVRVKVPGMTARARKTYVATKSGS